MRTPATLKKISEHLNISISTVSRALKDHPDVSPDTKRRVKELAEMLDYEPNAFAVNLRKKHSNLFAILVPEISGYFYHSFIQAVEEEARAIGFNAMILQSMNNPEVEKQNLKLCRYNHVAGIFVSITDSTIRFDPFIKMDEMEVPLIFFDKLPEGLTANKIGVSDAEVGRLAAEKLAGSGKRHIYAALGPQNLSITQRRQKGFYDYMALHAPHLAVSYANCNNEDEAQEFATQALKEQQEPLAFFCMSDQVMCGVQKAVYQSGRHIPDDVALLAVSNGFLPSLFYPEVSYVETSGYKLGKLAFARMKEIMEGKKFIRENYLDVSYHEGGTL